MNTARLRQALSEGGKKASQTKIFTVKPRAVYSGNKVTVTIGIQDYGGVVYTYSVER